MATFVPQLTRYTVVDDFGLVINPLTLGGRFMAVLPKVLVRHFMNICPMIQQASCWLDR